mmetsp:Transcript_21165/g.30613  ORF Transcript_21165/g.30613 Transcript_21165/m.30613 type:complete len:257 (+) Transcript_21165:60-830(+)
MPHMDEDEFGISSEMATPEERMNYYSQKALPESLSKISMHHDSLARVIEYLENEYLSCSPGNQQDVEDKAKMYLTDALGTVVQSISTVATHLEDLVGLQLEAVDALSTQMAQTKTRLQMCKEQHGGERLLSLRDPVSSPHGEYAREVMVGVTETGNSFLPAPTPGARLESLQTVHVPPPQGTYTRVPLSSRMNKFDNVGVCLQREERVSHDSIPPVSGVYERVRRSSNSGLRQSLAPTRSTINSSILCVFFLIILT